MKPLPIEEVARLPQPGMAIPNALLFSPDEQFITYLHSAEGSLSQQLYKFDLDSREHSLLLSPIEGGTTEDKVSIEEALRRERQRQYAVGVSEYAWNQASGRILVPLQGHIYMQDGPQAPLRKLVDGSKAPLLDPQFSPDGQWVAYVQEAELYVVAAEGGEPRQLTTEARENGKTHGLAEYIAQEEMQRSHGYWWSPDSRSLALTEVDETHIPIYRIVHQGKDAVIHEDHHFPFPGQSNARVRLGVIGLDGREATWLNLGDFEYLARVDWLRDGRLTAQLQNREQTELELVAFDLKTGGRITLLRETSPVWINLHDLLKPLQDGRLIWASERTGFLHLYLYDPEGNLIRPITTGEWMVDEIVGVDESKGQVYFTATKDGPTEKHLYGVSLEGGELRRITQKAGMHQVELDHGFARFIDVHSAVNQPPRVTLRSLKDDQELAVIYEQPDPRAEVPGLEPPQLVSFHNRNGTLLHGAIYRPSGDGPFPTIVHVYGGPHAQMVNNAWSMTVTMRAQLLRSLGFLVFTLDNRGSARRGLGFEGVIKHRMGIPEVEDQVDGVLWLVQQGLTDPARVGIYGWSYGGYMSLMCLAQAPEVFKVGVVGAPVTHWDGYDTYYTERYMGTPESNPTGYQQSSPLHHVHKLQGKFLLVHGLIDENVHFRHTARLINALIAARKPYDLLLFPDERHGPRKLEDRVYMEERIRDYFVGNL